MKQSLRKHIIHNVRLENNPVPQSFVFPFIIDQLTFGINCVGRFVELTQNSTAVNSEVRYKWLSGGLPIWKTDVEVAGLSSRHGTLVGQAK